MQRSEQAKKNFMSGLNCSQSVFLAFRDLTGLDEKSAMKLSAPLGGGVGRMREICGTVSAMMLVLGCVFYDAVQAKIRLDRLPRTAQRHRFGRFARGRGTHRGVLQETPVPRHVRRSRRHAGGIPQRKRQTLIRGEGIADTALRRADSLHPPFPARRSGRMRRNKKTPRPAAAGKKGAKE